MSGENQHKQIIQVLAKFRADLIWDQVIGIFDKIPQLTKQAVERQYQSALEAASTKLGIAVYELEAEIEDLAVEMVNGQAYSPEDVRKRLKEYGIEENQN
ncbi:MAG: hypothetical protein SFT81_02570 [Candidatus Caenarcaniphilales bacterium]|nr:hypothetical protein [Candidatus Caenarcaniphilales bacterium]